MIDHPLLNGHRCARFQVTRHDAFGPDNNHHIGVFYLAANFGRWAIFNQDQASMVAGAEFNVLVDPTAIDCPDPMFANGFE